MDQNRAADRCNYGALIMYRAGTWAWSEDKGQICQVIEAQTLWGETTCRVWLPGRDSVVRIPASRLKSLESVGTGSPDDIAYVAAAARVADALTQDVLLAPIASSVIPLPHQIRALSRAIPNDRARIARERKKANYAFAARRKTVERIGRPQVRNYRLNLLAQEERNFQEQLDQKAHAYPEMVPLLVIRVEGAGHE